MKTRGSGRFLRFAGCVGLMALLAASSYVGAGTNQVQAVGVPVTIETVSSQALSAVSLAETVSRLESEREQALLYLQSVLDDPRADDETAAIALDRKMEIAGRMETEAAVELLLAQMGFADLAVSAGEDVLSIVAPWQTAENEQSRIRIIDAASAQTGLAPARIKIILAKK